MKKLLPLILLLIGAGAGVGAGIFMRPEPDPTVAESSEDTAEVEKQAEENTDISDREYVKMNNQFVVPVVKGDSVQALVVMSLSLEVPAGQKDAIYSREPKLRDSFLQVLFDHANVGGFDGAFTNANNLAVLRSALREVAQKDMGDQISDVLILEIARQDY
ncbi:flagellar basal body-associated FliL family protein [Tateyamaria omphalii]|uniref:flagellar basal body-associated FliL family protein n=1 Tax=Tateyamaria omphalii TaxID=299262 RepID=UPI001C98F4B9|nr:flagellar basal body-associated FliL family protein [Tateyamaria omphalii]MBY5933627.1 flagellar basal body-associated FliL family protein [Tateyamaria omphalii]